MRGERLFQHTAGQLDRPFVDLDGLALLQKRARRELPHDGRLRLRPETRQWHRGDDGLFVGPDRLRRKGDLDRFRGRGLDGGIFRRGQIDHRFCRRLLAHPLGLHRFNDVFDGVGRVVDQVVHEVVVAGLEVVAVGLRITPKSTRLATRMGEAPLAHRDARWGRGMAVPGRGAFLSFGCRGEGEQRRDPSTRRCAHRTHAVGRPVHGVANTQSDKDQCAEKTQDAEDDDGSPGRDDPGQRFGHEQADVTPGPPQGPER